MITMWFAQRTIVRSVQTRFAGANAARGDFRLGNLTGQDRRSERAVVDEVGARDRVPHRWQGLEVGARNDRLAPAFDIDEDIIPVETGDLSFDHLSGDPDRGGGGAGGTRRADENTIRLHGWRSPIDRTGPRPGR